MERRAADKRRRMRVQVSIHNGIVVGGTAWLVPTRDEPECLGMGGGPYGDERTG